MMEKQFNISLQNLADSLAKSLHREIYYFDEKLNLFADKYRISKTDSEGTVEIKFSHPVFGNGFIYPSKSFSTLLTKNDVEEAVKEECGSHIYSVHAGQREISTVAILVFIKNDLWHWRHELYHDIFRMLENCLPICNYFDLNCVNQDTSEMFKSVLTI